RMAVGDGDDLAGLLTEAVAGGGGTGVGDKHRVPPPEAETGMAEPEELHDGYCSGLRLYWRRTPQEAARSRCPGVGGILQPPISLAASLKRDAGRTDRSKQWDDYAAQLREKLPAAPEGLLEWYVKWAPRLAIIFGVIGLVFLLMILVAGAAFASLALILG